MKLSRRNLPVIRITLLFQAGSIFGRNQLFAHSCISFAIRIRTGR